MNPVLTVDDLLQATHTGNGFHYWPVKAGVIMITSAQLILALEAAYDPSMENWPALVSLPSTGFNNVFVGRFAAQATTTGAGNAAEINRLFWSSINA